LEFVPVRGNVGTRIEKIVRGELDGVVLAAAGLRRLGKADSITHSFSFSECIPAIGQGALALECRASDAATARLLSALDDPLTAEAVKLERRFMKAVGGGCKVPMAAHAYPYGDGFRFLAAMGDASAGRRVRVERALDARFPEADVDDLAGEILEECAAAERLAWVWVWQNDLVLSVIEGQQNVRVIRYEDLCSDPIGITAELFRFADLDWSEQTGEFIELSTRSDHDSFYALTKDPARSARKWRNELSFEDGERMLAVVRGSRAAALFGLE
jgi:hypothetical protein